VGLLAGPLWLSAWYVARANPTPATAPWRMALAGVFAATVTAGLWAALGQIWWQALGETLGLAVGAPDARGLFPLLFGLGALGYLLAVTVYSVMHAIEEAARLSRRALELDVAQREAELRALRAQLDPHFLFNSLNSVAGLIPADPGRAREMCQRLADFFRDSLRLGATGSIPLAREVALAEQYLRIEQVRFGDRLALRTSVADDTAAVPVPPLLLQPLVENAVRHGVAATLDRTEVAIATRRAGSRIVIVITNPRDEDATPRGTGLGLAIVRRRLAAAYGEAGALTVEREPAVFRASVVVPAGEDT
jgi:LytS/YehU family sensor histidine kinase